MVPNITEIKKDIQSLSAKDFYIKYIIKSTNWYFSEYQKASGDEILEKMDTFKQIISENFGVSFHSAQIVGSAKLGVSLSPKKRFRKFIVDSEDGKEPSDIDIAIVSRELFELIWAQLRNIRHTCLIPNYKALANSIFRGYINDKDFKDIDLIRKDWNERISKANIQLQDKLSIMHPISYRIYRSWEDLEDYQLDGIKELQEGNYEI